jgi:hypothetical protein
MLEVLFKSKYSYCRLFDAFAMALLLAKTRLTKESVAQNNS